MIRPDAGVPQEPVPVPQLVSELAAELGAAGEPEPVWRNALGALTFKAHRADAQWFIKWQDLTALAPAQQAEADLKAEAARLRWAGQFVNVPEVVDDGARSAQAWLVTRAISGLSAYAPQWRQHPEETVRAIALGLRRFHDALPVADCPFPLSWASAAPDAPAPEQLVVCHGDPCVPNTLLDERGQFLAHVDVGALGVGDRWADLAIATYSISWKVNFGRSYDQLFFSTYGVDPDPVRINYYRQLWDRS